MEIHTIILLLLSGLAVGFLNTLSAGATVISMTTFMALGLPVIEASGTNRVAVLLQNLTSSLTFRKQNLLDVKTASIYAIPTIVGMVVGAQLSINAGNEIYNKLFAAGLVIMLILLVARPQAWLKNSSEEIKKVNFWHILALFVVGIYGGSVYVGLGYFIITICVVSLGYDLIRANAVKSFLAFTTTPFSLIIYMMHGEVNYSFGLVHAIGNIIGAYFAAKYSTKIGVKYIRILLICLISASLILVLTDKF